MRGTRFHVVAVIAAGAMLAGCGSETHENEPRPPVPTVMSVAVNERTIELAPEDAGQPGQTQANVSQNYNAPQNQADQEAPLVVNFAIANLTDEETELILEGPREIVTSLTPSGSGSFVTSLPTGVYRLSSPASASTTRFNVGDSRISSGGDVLIP